MSSVSGSLSPFGLPLLPAPSGRAGGSESRGGLPAPIERNAELSTDDQQRIEAERRRDRQRFQAGTSDDARARGADAEARRTGSERAANGQGGLPADERGGQPAGGDRLSSGASSAYAAQQIFQEALGSGLTLEPFGQATAAYQRVQDSTGRRNGRDGSQVIGAAFRPFDFKV
jgi:hypothetical protein